MYTTEQIRKAGEDGEINYHEVEHLIKILERSRKRVRFYPTDTIKTFDGTVIEEVPNYYIVIPDRDSDQTQRWNKKRCDVLNL